ncbi:MAG: hypothetical protein KJ882_05065 [Proteobacteria bacterium]|nr:hypothetical protein [Pseudomonadota bacterium]MBU4010116.1 hypothetical protein [Pseudomonadota bacterium]
MGRKQTGKREHFFFYLTCIIIVFDISVFSGCALNAKHKLMETQDLMTQGDYNLALEKDQQILKECPQIGDYALFHMGLILAHPDNPDKDYKNSLKYFKKLIEEFPGSNLRNDAQIWASLLNGVIKQQAEAIRLIEKINLLKSDNQIKDKKIDELQKNNQIKDKKAEELQQQIEKLKEIDLNIQIKKRSVNLK